MNDKIKESFDQIRAEEELLRKTGAFLETRRRRRFFSYGRFAACAVSLLLVLGLGTYFWLIPVSAISVDVNPSLELELNRLDRVVTQKGFNAEGEAVAASVNLRFLSYEKALDKLLSDKTLKPYLEQGEEVTVTVAGSSRQKSGEILEGVTGCTSAYDNVCCSAGNSREVEAAHHAGMSFGKYKAYLELKSLDPSVTPEEVQDISMHDLQAWIRGLQQTEDPEIQETVPSETVSGLCQEQENQSAGCSGQGAGGSGQGNQYQKGRYNGQHKGRGAGHHGKHRG